MSWERFPPSRPIKAEGGIKARSSRGEIAQTWWSRRFIDVLESLGLGARLSRGRTYARAGQVLSLSICPGEVLAEVQGSRYPPYSVEIGLDILADEDWATVEEALAAQALFRAKLLAGEMPQDIEEVFGRCGVSLFPTEPHELWMECSCPDWAVPCKHVAAVFYLLAEAFDADPFLVLAWRGRAKDALLARLQELTGPGGGGDGPSGPDGPCEPAQVTAAARLPEDPPLAEQIEQFWSGKPWPGPASSRLVVPDLVLRESEPPAVKVGKRSLAEVLRPAYQTLTGRG